MSQTEKEKSKTLEEISQEFLEKVLKSPDLEKIEMLSSLFFSITEIAILCERDPDELRREIMFVSSSAVSKAYMRGKLHTQIKLRYINFIYANKGVPTGEEEMSVAFSKQQEDEYAKK